MKTWFRSRTRFERLFLIALCVGVPAEVVVKAVCHATAYGDFNVHLDFGRRFLAGTPLYADDLCFNYMPVSAMYYAPLSLFPAAVASLIRTSAAVGCLALSLHWLGAMVRAQARPGSWRGLTFAALAVVLTIQYVLRDLDDGGPHLIYLGLIVGSTYCVRRGREGLGAAGFGLAVALKMTPGLLLPFFAWKRKWRLAGLSVVATAAWIVLPAAWMGPSRWWDHQRQWNRTALSVVSDRPDAAREANEVRVQNQALKPAVARFLVTYPPGHALKVDHPADVPFLDLRPSTANRLGTLAGLAVLAAVAWWSRRPSTGPDDPAWPVELAAVMVLIPLLSPVTWLQHLVFVVPAAYLLAAGHRSSRPLGRTALGSLGLYWVLAVVLNRGLVGRGASLVLLSYHVHTLAMLVLLGVLMARRPMTLPAPTDPGDDRRAVRGPMSARRRVLAGWSPRDAPSATNRSSPSGPC
ncbi:MAG: DUF2029 domain-containing protein [Planctomycetia bacterium]|nr:DUF2029 domain-containing protein [Planctomycetia bacterium]